MVEKKGQELDKKTSNSGLLINKWEKLTALSNRRLTVQTMYSSQDIILNWSIDRLTLVGFERLHVRPNFLNQSYDYFNLDHVTSMLELSGVVSSTRDGWVLIDEYEENIAYFERTKFQKGKVRFDFNPSKLGRFLKTDIRDFINLIMTEPHFSRADVACDILDMPDDYMRSFQVLEPTSMKQFYGLGRKIETVYFGSRSSEKQVRLYNKKREQEVKGEVVPADVNTWWRLEVQLRRSKADDWANLVHQTLENFCTYKILDPKEVKLTEYAMCRLMFEEPSVFSDANRRTKYKYRDMVKEASLKDEFKQALFSTFDEQQAEIKRELNSWLNFIDVTPDSVKFD